MLQKYNCRETHTHVCHDSNCFVSEIIHMFIDEITNGHQANTTMDGESTEAEGLITMNTGAEEQITRNTGTEGQATSNTKAEEQITRNTRTAGQITRNGGTGHHEQQGVVVLGPMLHTYPQYSFLKNK